MVVLIIAFIVEFNITTTCILVFQNQWTHNIISFTCYTINMLFLNKIHFLIYFIYFMTRTRGIDLFPFYENNPSHQQLWRHSYKPSYLISNGCKTITWLSTMPYRNGQIQPAYNHYNKHSSNNGKSMACIGNAIY